MTPLLSLIDDLHTLFVSSHAELAWSVVFVAMAAGALSPLVVMNRLAFFTDAVAHASLLGVGIGLLMGSRDLLLPMLAVALVVSGGVWWLRRTTGQTADTLLGVLMTGSLALGVLLCLQSQSAGDIHRYLFGDLATVPASWFPIIAGAAALVLAVTLALFNRAALMAVSSDLARARGLNTAWAEALLVGLLAVVVTLGVRTLGILMINALLVVPGALARNCCRTLAGFFWVSVVAAALGGFIGLAVSYDPGWPPGPSVVLVLVTGFLGSLILKRRQ